jgi:hypothetical protein
MMGELIRIGEEIGADLREFLHGFAFSSSIRGVLLDVDDYWEFMQLGHMYSEKFPFWYSRDEYHTLFSYIHEYPYGPSFVDMAFRPYQWDEHCRVMGYPKSAQPIIIRVILKESSQIATSGLPRDFHDYPLVYEFRPTNRALTTIGLMERLRGAVGWRGQRETRKAHSIGRVEPNTAGTLGGVLGSADPRRNYLVTCAHVLGPPGTGVYQPGPFEGKNSQRVGTVEHWRIPNLGTTDDPCSEPATPDAARLDLAVAESTVNVESLREMGAVTMANLIRPIVAIRKHDPVTFTGKTRGLIEAKVGALTLWDQIEFPDGVRCFGRIFEIKSPTRQYIREDLAYPGDSGSWIVFQVGDLVAWYGMVISCDGGQAYGCFAEYILEECNASGVFAGGLKLLA